MAIITNLTVPYPDFKLHEVIDPEQFDFNNGAIVEKMNVVLGIINQITESVAQGGSGADKISITPILPFTSTKLQGFLTEVIARLTSAQGAGFIGSSGITGVSGTTVWAQLNSLKTLLDTEKARVDALTTRMGTAETNIANRYTKTEVDAKDAFIQAQVTTDKTNITALQLSVIDANKNATVALTNSTTAVTTSTSANTKSDSAVATSNTANATSTSANTKSDNAVTTANSANTKADSAIITSNTALTNSTTAVNDSSTALSASNQAFTKSESALLTAEGANVKSDQAVTTSNSASTVSNTNSARIDNLVGSVTVDGEVIDARVGSDNVARATVGTLLREVHAQSIRKANITSTLSTGVSTVTGEVSALAEAEIEGRTLISLANSNLEASKQYVLADKKTKVIVDGVTQSGVAKFTKGTTTVSTANFLNKVSGSTVVNPHVSKSAIEASLLSPTSGSFAETTSGYPNISSLNGAPYLTRTISTNGAIAQQLFSFDIIAEIERKLGVIPKATLAEKVQWVKDNVEMLMYNWHGFGSSVGGNKAKFDVWYADTNQWYSQINAGAPLTTHTNGVVTKLSTGITAIANKIDVNGFVHFLAYAEPSDGITASSISTDFIDLVVTLKATAQLNTRPTIIRVENFEGKVSGSVVENAHINKNSGFDNALLIPSSTAWGEGNSGSYSSLSSVNSNLHVTSRGNSGNIAQQLFSFNLIEAIDRNVGKIPRTSVADKVQWLKDNVSYLASSWYGFGSSVGGNKANYTVYLSNSSAWDVPGAKTHTTASVTKLARIVSTGALNVVDTNGFVHFLAYADASDGVVASTINTDYIDLEIELRSTADFTRPKVALYEVTSDSYAKILVDWNADEIVNRYPSVEGVQHLQGVGVVAEGENLLPPFSEWTLHANAKVVSPYEAELNATANSQLLTAYINVTPNTILSLSVEHNGKMIVQDANTLSNVLLGTTTLKTGTFNTGSSKMLALSFYNHDLGIGKFTFKNPMLTLGTTAKPFVPRNPSYLYADVKLGAIGTVADRLYEQDGAKFVRKVVEHLTLDGSLAWLWHDDLVGYKRFKIPSYAGLDTSKSLNSTLASFSGGILKPTVTTDNSNQYRQISGDAVVYVAVSDIDTGFGEAHAPSTQEVKAYFYGYKMNNGTYGTPYDGTGTKTWIPIGDTTNARAVTVVPTSASPTQLDGTIQPYKLSYVLATPQTVNVTDKVEGSLKVSGLTQVEVLSGIVRREKVVPKLTAHASRLYLINDVSTFYNVNTPLKNKASKFVAIYKNGVVDNNWTIQTLNNGEAYGSVRAYQSQDKYDPTADYFITYIALDKHLLTANPTNVKLTYAINQAGALQGAIGRIENNTRDISNHGFFIDYVEAKTDNNRVDLTVAQADIVGLKSSVSSGKTQLATAITGKGVASSGTDTFAVLSTNIGLISKGQGNAIETQVLAPSTFSNADGVLRTGTMVNRGAVNIIPSFATAQPIPAGYHNGSGTVAIGSRIATGDGLSSSYTIGFKNYSNSQITLPAMVVTGLPFRPKCVVVHRGGYSVTTYNSEMALWGDQETDVLLTIMSGTVYHLRNTMWNGDPLITATGFTIPVSNTSQTYFWTAYEF